MSALCPLSPRQRRSNRSSAALEAEAAPLSSPPPQPASTATMATLTHRIRPSSRTICHPPSSNGSPPHCHAADHSERSRRREAPRRRGRGPERVGGVSWIASGSVMSSALRFSVIIPLEFHRGQAVRCVRGWAEGQLFPREQFEIVVASPADHPKAELDEIRGLLGPQDQMLQFDRHHDMDLCARPPRARAARCCSSRSRTACRSPGRSPAPMPSRVRTRSGPDSAAARSRSPATSCRRSRRSGTGRRSSSA